MKIPEKDASLLYQEVDEGVAGEDLRILGGLRGGDGKKEARLLQPTHHLDDPVKMAFPSPGIRFFSQSLEADGKGNISEGHKSLDHLLIDQGRIRIDLKKRIRVGLKEVEEILSDKRLPSGHHDQMDSDLFALFHQPIEHLVRKFSLRRVGPRITSIATQIAPHGGTDQHGIGRVKSPLLFDGLSAVGPHEELIDDQVGDDLFPVMGMGLIEEPSCNGESRMVGLKESADPSDLLLIGFLLRNLFCQVGETDQVFLSRCWLTGKMPQW